MLGKSKLSPLAAFKKAARDNGMTYAQLQVMETCGKVKITKTGRLVWRKH